jgi:prepilin-type N-terminal cleavage/methylation domain-containing protein
MRLDPRPRPSRRAGHTLPELVVVLAVAGVVAAAALGALRTVADRTGARMAASDLAALLAEARDVALAASATVAVVVDARDGRVTLRDGPDTLLVRRLAELHGVRLASSRDSVTYSSLGMGRGAANARFVLARGAAAETVWVSRLGRVRVGGGE